jgi:hypothetical protein
MTPLFLNLLGSLNLPSQRKGRLAIRSFTSKLGNMDKRQHRQSVRNYKYEIRYNQEKYVQWRGKKFRDALSHSSALQKMPGTLKRKAQSFCSDPQPCATMNVAQGSNQRLSSSQMQQITLFFQPTGKHLCTENPSIAPVCSYV